MVSLFAWTKPPTHLGSQDWPVFPAQRSWVCLWIMSEKSGVVSLFDIIAPLPYIHFSALVGKEADLSRFVSTQVYLCQKMCGIWGFFEGVFFFLKKKHLMNSAAWSPYYPYIAFSLAALHLFKYYTLRAQFTEKLLVLGLLNFPMDIGVLFLSQDSSLCNCLWIGK